MTTSSVSAIKKKTGRPATGVGTPVVVRFQPSDLDALDAWRAAQPDSPTRPEAVRMLLRKELLNGQKPRS